MSPLRRPVAAVSTLAVLSVPALALTATPAHAVDKSQRCDGARMELSVERADGGFEVEADVDDATPGSRWRIVMRHDGKRFFKDVCRADGEGDISVDRDRRDTAGRDVFKLRVNRVGTDGGCTLRIVRR